MDYNDSKYEEGKSAYITRNIYVFSRKGYVR